MIKFFIYMFVKQMYKIKSTKKMCFCLKEKKKNNFQEIENSQNIEHYLYNSLILIDTLLFK